MTERHDTMVLKILYNVIRFPFFVLNYIWDLVTGLWIWKIVWRVIRSPLVAINFCWEVIINRNILILFIILAIVCSGGATYRHSCKKIPNIMDLCQKIVENGPTAHCLVCESHALPHYISDLYKWTVVQNEEHSWPNAFIWSLNRMFDYGEVLDSTRRCWRWEGCVAITLFLFTWLIGGGGLVGSIISIMKFFHDGGWRRWACLLWNHTVILGWDDNAVTIIREHLDSRRCSRFLCHWAMPERIVILTSRDVEEVRRKLIAILRQKVSRRIIILYDIYRGEYDDPNELKRLNLSHANAVYVLGEKNDQSHDARVLMLPQVMINASSKSWWNPLFWVSLMEKAILMRSFFKMWSVVRLELHLASFGLYIQQLRMNRYGQSEKGKIIGDRIIDVAYRNFYDSWAKRLFANYWSLANGGDDSLNVRLRYDKSPRVHFVIVGFSEMGQALAVQAARVAHYGDDVKVYITVFDDEIEMREIEFRSLFPRIDEVADVHWTFMHDAKVGSDMFMEKIVDFSKMGDALTVAIACEDSAEGMKVALPIYNKTRNANSRNIQVLLRQDVIGRIMPKHEEAPVLNEETPSIRVYGMRDGSGYNAWFRDDSAISLYSKKNGVAEKEGRRMWCKVHMPAKCQYEMLLDVMEETYEVLDVMEDDGKRMKVLSAIRKANEILDDPKEVIISSSHIVPEDFSKTQLLALEFVQKRKRKTKAPTKDLS